ncbi:mannose-1-phosphate guanylyltransferase/mannose-6-phosphate isomerase [Tepidiphilus olei]|uniref:mannose-1-phosphate guanylyltransferase/mannose-6-phosphate isomerase n=1 Tax=Tepidiphilus olei TaxID=2502184 RepID=UPI00115ED8B9|nr:mannose-1-phosphate guanylyltransferase/mannose-6-phosphate isomerase [Tepidiphilus olei]
MLIPVILSGGAGTRLWPVSREGHPKPFITLPDGETLLHKTYRRAAALHDEQEGVPAEILTVTNRDYYFLSKDEFARAGLDRRYRSTFLLEPVGRNTAAAVALAAHVLAERHGPDALLLVLPADHLITDEAAFRRAVGQAAQLASQQRLVTFGVVPDRPETGYGYIEAGEALGPGRAVVRFVEKPALDLARQYLEAGNFYWNAGMFCFQAGVLLEQMARYAPDVAEAAARCWERTRERCTSETALLELDAESFAAIPDISLDYALMERSEAVAVVPAEFDWSDIGSWCALSVLATPDEAGNRARGEALFFDSRNTYVHSEDRLVAALGVEELLIVDTPDALLVAHRDKAQDVKHVVARLKARDHDVYKFHRTVVRPWGSYTVLEEGPGFKIKRIEVKPGASLSLQMHHHRSEHWIVVRGMAKIINGEKECYVRPNESTYIPAGHKHRLENPGILDLVMIEVQCGDYLGEDDIVRFQDDYGRA